MSARRALALAAALAAGAARADGAEAGFPSRQAQALGLSGSVRAGYWGASRDLLGGRDVGAVALWLAAQPGLGENVSLRVEGWLGDQDVMHPAHPAGQLREASLDATFGPLAVRVGRQISVWGRADALNPTDNLAPRDYTLLTPEDADQRLGLVEAKASLALGSFTLHGYWLPEFRPNRLPLGAAPTGVTMQEVGPDRAAAQVAVRLERSGGAVDWSLSYFDGFDRNPDFSVLSAGPTGVALGLRHGRTRVVGADAASTLGRFGVRGEVAYTFTEDWAGADPLTKNPFLFGVVGADRTFFEHLNVNLQYALRVISRWQDPALAPAPLRLLAHEEALLTQQLDRVQQGLTARIAYKWLDETLEGELSGVYWFPRHDFIVRPRLAYAVSDHLKALVGVDVYGGPLDSFLGRLHDDTAVYTEIRYGF